MADCANVAATLHAHLCEHDWHGYTQGSGRWGDGEGVCAVNVDGRGYDLQQGDRDCSSSVIECWQLALQGTAYEGALGTLGSGGPTYTGNMRAAFVGTGLFEWKPMSFTAQRGDVYLNERDHTAMCQSAVPDMLSQFSINENGGITGGQVGDQTGGESSIRGYYDFPWDGILHYNGKADAAAPATILDGNDKEEEDMNQEQNAKLDAIFNRITRTDNQGHKSPDGHDMFGRVNMLQEDMADVRNQLTRTDTAGHDNPDGHNIYGRVQIIERDVRDIGDKLDQVLAKM